MSDQSWAIEKMFKYRLQVDFRRHTIDCNGFTSGWYWGANKTFYEALQEAINDIERVS